MDERGDSMEVRMGTFFVVLGAGAFLLFVVSDMADKVDFDYFFVALILLTIGFYFRRKKAPPPPSGRFTWFKGFWGNMRKGKAPKENKEKK